MNYLFIISGPGGSGKDAVIDKIIKDPQLNLIKMVNHTSRLPRVGETDGVDYHFVTKDQFEKEISRNQMLEYEVMESNHHYYGTHQKEVAADLKKGNTICAKMPIGALKLKEFFGDQAVTIFIDANDAELERRLLHNDRSHEHENTKRRLDQAKTERTYKSQYDYSLMNHDGQIDETVEKVKKIVLQTIAN